MIKINLVPQEILDREQQRLQAIQLSAVGAAVVAVWLGVTFAHYYRGVQYARELAENEEKFQKLQVVVQQVEQLEATAQAVRTRLNVITDLLKSRPLYPRFMEDLLRVIPAGVWLTNLGTTTEGETIKVTMGCKAVSTTAIAEWLRALESSDRFSAPLLGPITIGPEGSAFSMSAAYKMPAAQKAGS